MSPRIDRMIEHGCVPVCAVRIICRSGPPQRIVVVAVLIIMCVFAERRVESVQHRGLVCGCASKMVMVGQCGPYISRLPVADTFEVCSRSIQLRRDFVNACLGNRDMLSLGFMVAELLEEQSMTTETVIGCCCLPSSW